MFDLAGRIDADLFAEYFRVVDQRLIHILEDIQSALLNDSPYRGVLLVGHSGIGKTTIIHYFLEMQQTAADYTYVSLAGPNSDPPYDPSAVARILNIPAKQAGELGPAKEALRPDETAARTNAEPLHAELKNERNRAYLARIFAFLQSHYQTSYLNIPPPLRQHLREAKDTSAQSIDTAIEQLDVSASLTLLLLCVYARQVDSKHRQHFLVLDNIDAIGALHIARLFQDWLAIALDASRELWRLKGLAEQVCPKNGSALNRVQSVEQRCKIILSIRDANYTVTNAHRRDRYPLLNSRFISLPPETHAAILRKRLSLIRRLEVAKDRNKEHHDLMISTVDHLLGEHRFVGMLDRMFNGDFRTSAIAIFKCIYSDDLIHLKEVFSQPELSLDNRASAMMHFMMKYLHDIGFIAEYNRQFLLHYDKKKGYCHHVRMILNVIRNMSSMQGDHIILPAHRMSAGTPSLLSVIEAFEGIFPPSEVVDTLDLIFGFYALGWSQMVSIYGVNINDPTERELLYRDVEFLLSTRNNAAGLRGGDLARIYSETRLRLASIHIAICPAGDFFVDRIAHNFEFYTILADPMSESIFINGLEELPPSEQSAPIKPKFVPDENDGAVVPSTHYRFRFERVMRGVLEVLSGHALVTRRFYDKVVRKPMPWYLLSELCNWPGDPRHRRRDMPGRFHISRAITQHLDTILKFYHFARQTELDESTSLYISKSIQQFVQRYCQLAHTCKFFDEELTRAVSEAERWLLGDVEAPTSE